MEAKLGSLDRTSKTFFATRFLFPNGRIRCDLLSLMISVHMDSALREESFLVEQEIEFLWRTRNELMPVVGLTSDIKE
jgi:hypothetical protein